MSIDHIEPDYLSAAEAWMVLEMTKEMIRHCDKCIQIATEYATRLIEESNVGVVGD